MQDDSPEQQKIEIADDDMSPAPEVAIKYIKLNNQECIVGMIEWGTTEETANQITIYNPLRITPINPLDMIPQQAKFPFIIDEWLPNAIVAEQVCVIHESDVLTMVDVSEKFAKSYTKTILNKVALEEIVRNGKLFERDKTYEDMRSMEDESAENTGEELGELVSDKIKKFRNNFN